MDDLLCVSHTNLHDGVSLARNAFDPVVNTLDGGALGLHVEIDSGSELTVVTIYGDTLGVDHELVGRVDDKAPGVCDAQALLSQGHHICCDGGDVGIVQ